MGRIATFLTGVFILGVSQAVGLLEAYANSVEGAPVDYGMIVNYASLGFLALGLAITGYTLLSAVFSIVKHNYQKRKELQQEEQARRRGQRPEQGYDQSGQQARGGQQQAQQRQPRGQQGQRQQPQQRRRGGRQQNR